MKDSILAAYFQGKRLELGLTTAEVAAQAGYKNLTKGANILHEFEVGGRMRLDRLEKFAKTLGIEWSLVELLAEQDRLQVQQTFDAWADVPTKPFFVCRLFSAMYIHPVLPEGLTQQQMEEYVSAYAARMKLRCCLVLSRRLSIFYNPDGTVENRAEATPNETNAIWMQVENKRFTLKGEVT